MGMRQENCRPGSKPERQNEIQKMALVLARNSALFKAAAININDVMNDGEAKYEPQINS
jgi:hypothetical protein